MTEEVVNMTKCDVCRKETISKDCRAIKIGEDTFNVCLRCITIISIIAVNAISRIQTNVKEVVKDE